MFALPPIVIIIVQVFGLLVGPHTIRHQLFTDMSGVFGTEAARQIITIIRAFRKVASSTATNVLLLFIFYSAMILYYGVAFTKTWSVYKEQPLTSEITA